jgi:hypothetical protein
MNARLAFRISRSQDSLVRMSAPRLTDDTRGLPVRPPLRIVTPATATIGEILSAKQRGVIH